MKFRLLLLVFVFIFCTLVPAADKGAQPAPALSGLPGVNEIAIGPMFNLHTDLNTGYGVNATLSHYFTRHFGISSDSEYLKLDTRDLTEYAFRAGPSIHFYEKGRFRPFARALVGYARWKATYTVPSSQLPFRGPAGSYPYDGGLSFLVGAGTDIRVSGPISARVAGDFMDDGPTHNDKTRLVRLSVGLTYRFGGAE